ncbi:MAG: hypothetical protein ACE5IQ_06640 [Candidatus Methylomirabilales bacterium]
MAALQQTLQGAKVREDVYILRQLHHGDGEGTTLLAYDPPPESGSPPSSPHATEVPPAPSGQETGPPRRTPKPRRQQQEIQPEPMASAFSAEPPLSVGPEDLPALIRWFLNHDRSIPNNLAVLEEAHRIVDGGEHHWTYERRLAWVIADDLRTYDSPEVLQEHLALLTTVYARTIQALRRLGSHHPGLRSPADLPEAEQREMWELCRRLGFTATRLRVESWIYRRRHGEPPSVKPHTPQRRSSVRAYAGPRNPR